MAIQDKDRKARAKYKKKGCDRRSLAVERRKLQNFIKKWGTPA
jgi:hypothetical protein